MKKATQVDFKVFETKEDYSTSLWGTNHAQEHGEEGTVDERNERMKRKEVNQEM